LQGLGKRQHADEEDEDCTHQGDRTAPSKSGAGSLGSRAALVGNAGDTNKHHDDQADAKNQDNLRVPVKIASDGDDGKEPNKPQHTDGNETGANGTAVPAHLDIQWLFCPIFQAAPVRILCADFCGGRRNRELGITERAILPPCLHTLAAPRALFQRRRPSRGGGLLWIPTPGLATFFRHLGQVSSTSLIPSAISRRCRQKGQMTW